MKSELPTGMSQTRVPVLIHRCLARDHFLMRAKAPQIARRARPGQFLHVRCGEGQSPSGKGQSPTGTVPLLRRPFSLLDVDPQRGTVDFIYKVVGLGTGALSRVPQGAEVDLLGPLGRPFEIPVGLKRAYLLGGGVGIPPLYLLAKRLKKQCRVTAFLGARTKDWVICIDQFRALGVETHVATDDGTWGHKGSVVDLFSSVIATPSGARWKHSRFKNKIASDAVHPRNDAGLYICGPTPMMAAAAKIARANRLSAQVSLEERMGCAMGCCMGCVVEVNTEPAESHARFQRVCTEGPIFPAEVVVWP